MMPIVFKDWSPTENIGTLGFSGKEGMLCIGTKYLLVCFRHLRDRTAAHLVVRSDSSLFDQIRLDGHLVTCRSMVDTCGSRM